MPSYDKYVNNYTSGAAVAQEVCGLPLQPTCQSILEQDTEPHTALMPSLVCECEHRREKALHRQKEKTYRLRIAKRMWFV